MPMIEGSTPAVAHDTIRASGFSPRFLASVGGHQHQGGRAVIDARGVAGGDRAVLVEGRAQLGQRLDRRAVADVFVLVDHRLALAGLHRHRRDLVLELPAFCAASALFCEAVANWSCSSRVIWYLLRDVLGGVAHVIAVEDVPQAVLDHGVDQLERRPSWCRCAGARRAGPGSCSPGRRRR